MNLGNMVLVEVVRLPKVPPVGFANETGCPVVGGGRRRRQPAPLSLSRYRMVLRYCRVSSFWCGRKTSFATRRRRR